MTTIAGRAMRGAGLLCVASLPLSGTGCVSADAGSGTYEAKPIDAAGRISASGETTPEGIAISADEVPSFSSPYLGAVRVILKNTTLQFIRIDSVSLSFGGELDKHISIPAGDDLSGWGRAMAPRVQHWVGRRHRDFAYEPTSDILTDIQRFEQRRLGGGQNAPAFPSEHLFASPFSIPPGLSTIKWVLIQSDANVHTCLEQMLVTLQTAEHEPQRLLVRFRDKALTQSEWQRAACATSAPKPNWGI